jgi:hypothetical protein
MAVPEVEPQPDMTDTVEKNQNKTEMMEEEEVRHVESQSYAKLLNSTHSVKGNISKISPS